MSDIIRVMKVNTGLNIKLFLESTYKTTKTDTPLKKLVVDKLTWGMEPELLMVLKRELIGVVWAQDMWADVALAFSEHYWDGIPGKYFREWGVLENYLEEKDEAGGDKTEV
jgi:hypothetical protein